MRANHTLRQAVTEIGNDLYMIYDVENGDRHNNNWLFEGLSHDCTHVWQSKPNDKLRPFRTRCGIYVSTHLDKIVAPLFILVRVETTCIWCMGGKVRE